MCVFNLGFFLNNFVLISYFLKYFLLYVGFLFCVEIYLSTASPIQRSKEANKTNTAVLV